MVHGVDSNRRMRTRSIGIVIGVLIAAVAALAGSGQARAIPEYTEPNLVTTLKCGSANPWPLGPLPVRVDVFNQIRFPADGLPGPAISLIGYSLTKPQALEYTAEVRVTWRNLRTVGALAGRSASRLGSGGLPHSPEDRRDGLCADGQSAVLDLWGTGDRLSCATSSVGRRNADSQGRHDDDAA